VIRWVASGLLALMVGGAGADLSASSPADRAILDRPPSTVDVTFAGTLDRPLSHVTVRSTAGEDVDVGTGVAPSAGAAGRDAEHEHGVDPLGGTLLLIDLLVLAAVLALLWLRRPGQRTLDDARRILRAKSPET
jgi:hypothetical protein